MWIWKIPNRNTTRSLFSCAGWKWAFLCWCFRSLKMPLRFKQCSAVWKIFISPCPFLKLFQTQPSCLRHDNGDAILKAPWTEARSYLKENYEDSIECTSCWTPIYKCPVSGILCPCCLEYHGQSFNSVIMYSGLLVIICGLLVDSIIRSLLGANQNYFTCVLMWKLYQVIPTPNPLLNGTAFKCASYSRVFALYPCSCLRWSLGTAIQGKTFTVILPRILMQPWWMSTDYYVTRGILKFQCLTWESHATSWASDTLQYRRKCMWYSQES